MKNVLKNLLRDEEGATMVEYIIIVALVALFAFVAIMFFGERIRKLFDRGSQKLEEADQRIGR